MKKLSWIALAISMVPVCAHALAGDEENTFHFQTTTVTQAHPAFDAPYSGPNSMSRGYESRTSLTSTLFLGHRLWSGAGLYCNPELSALSGLSATHGISAFPNGEIYRVDDPSPKLSISRLFIQQVFGLGGESEAIEDDVNQLSGHQDSRRITVVAGKFSLNDYLDGNTYSHDPRTQFLSWVLMDNGAWDYAADTRGYTWGIYLEYRIPNWSFRVASVLVPEVANELTLDPRFLVVRGDNAEVEYRYTVSSHPGAVRFLGYRNVAHMGNYAESLSNNPSSPDITNSEEPENRVKFGFGLNFEQELTTDLGIFARAGWNNGSTESWAFTEVDDSLSGGAVLKGSSWGRGEDRVGFALIWDGLSHSHANYLANGGQGFILGDGGLSYAPEEVLETYYSYQLLKSLSITGDYQFVDHPGFNSDRGPVHIFGLRVHYEI